MVSKNLLRNKDAETLKIYDCEDNSSCNTVLGKIQGEK